MGDIDQAQKQYQRVLERGYARAFNNLWRVYISQKKVIPAESLQRKREIGLGKKVYEQGSSRNDRSV